ncbi:Zn(2)-C6 fungal-type domain-containing protein [Mycena sanguinolenta]|uniref:Zn(2)-C6 fungal-type domain-containing protein n=1 Tax=Mycena sanguinolenta TaxID=230812 RepID=A0A8H6ZJ10_9AGAR|nr:Zn(2)-C6 fungal-type domain-containing protein [Mycena sanguinolenta]
MSSTNPGKPHRQKPRRPCDVCRRRKTGCHQSETPGEKCGTCREADLDCTYVSKAVKRRTTDHVRALEARLKHSESIVHGLRAELARMSPHSVDADLNLDGLIASLHIMRATMSSLYTDLGIATEKDVSLGNSSEAALAKAAIVHLSETHTTDKEAGIHNSAKSPLFRQSPSQNTIHYSHRLNFPPKPLMNQLLELYFTRHNIYFPLLHRPIFEHAIAESLHLRDDSFAATVLLVCAIASRWMPDSSVVKPDRECGREWFDQVPPLGRRLIRQATLYDLQYYCLSVFFIEGFSAPQACWTLIGIGLRLAQDLGVHLRKGDIQVPSVEKELYKRAFWVLVYLDRVTSAEMGRTCALQYDDFDVDLPLEVDDEYWEHPTHPFQQPSGAPSRVTFFNTLMRLNHILGFCLKGLYSSSKLLALFSINGGWTEYAVHELDAILSTWHAQIPDHLRWDPLRTDQVFFDQSVALHCAWYHVQIVIHRPSISILPKSQPMSPSLTTCATAARACANIATLQRKRNANAPAVMNLRAVFSSGLILLLHLWSARRIGLGLDHEREMADVHKCMEVILLCESRWPKAGMLWDILAELACVGRIPLHDPGENFATRQVHGTPNPFESLRQYTPEPRFSLEDLSAYMRMYTALGQESVDPELQADPIAMWMAAPIWPDADVWESSWSV